MGDLASHLVVVDVDLAVDGLLLIDAFNDIASAQVEHDRIASRFDLVAQSLDLGEYGW